MRSPWTFLVFLPAALLVSALVWACGTDAIGIDTCKAIQRERCRWVKACEINVDTPTVIRRDKGTTGVDDCIRFYDDACLHGMAAADPGDAAVSACIAAINSGDCEIVRHPEIDPACAWIIPPPDSGSTQADAGDAATE
jgi:hypothetical protein